MGTTVVLDFVEAINNANPDKMIDLMTIDHVFIDSQDNRTIGKDKMRQAWIGYFAIFPDYRIEINEILEKDKAHGTGGPQLFHAIKFSSRKNMVLVCRLFEHWRALLA